MPIETDEVDLTVVDEHEESLAVDDLPEGLVEDLDLADHLKGYWPSSKNVTQ